VRDDRDEAAIEDSEDGEPVKQDPDQHRHLTKYQKDLAGLMQSLGLVETGYADAGSFITEVLFKLNKSTRGNAHAHPCDNARVEAGARSPLRLSDRQPAGPWHVWCTRVPHPEARCEEMPQAILARAETDDKIALDWVAGTGWSWRERGVRKVNTLRKQLAARAAQRERMTAALLPGMMSPVDVTQMPPPRRVSAFAHEVTAFLQYAGIQLDAAERVPMLSGFIVLIEAVLEMLDEHELAGVRDVPCEMDGIVLVSIRKGAWRGAWSTRCVVSGEPHICPDWPRQAVIYREGEEASKIELVVEKIDESLPWTWGAGRYSRDEVVSLLRACMARN
jgi:hypothetical protein